MTVKELKEMIDNGEDFQLIDIRQPEEREMANIGGKHIMMGEIPERLDEISKTEKVVLYCRSGRRSGIMLEFMRYAYGYTNLINLEGGILAWAEEIDPSIEPY
jgi:rhodanese-related sulfurtransferase